MGGIGATPVKVLSHSGGALWVCRRASIMDWQADSSMGHRGQLVARGKEKVKEKNTFTNTAARTNIVFIAAKPYQTYITYQPDLPS